MLIPLLTRLIFHLQLINSYRVEDNRHACKCSSCRDCHRNPPPWTVKCHISQKIQKYDITYLIESNKENRLFKRSFLEEMDLVNEYKFVQVKNILACKPSNIITEKRIQLLLTYNIMNLLSACQNIPSYTCHIRGWASCSKARQEILQK